MTQKTATKKLVTLPTEWINAYNHTVDMIYKALYDLKKSHDEKEFMIAFKSAYTICKYYESIDPILNFLYWNLIDDVRREYAKITCQK